MAKSQAQLQEIARSYGLNPEGLSNDGVIRMIAEEKVKRGEVVNPLSQIEVMNARNFEDEHEGVQEQDLLLMGSCWVAEPKLDGVHFKLHIFNPAKGRPNRLDSRRKSDLTFHFSEKTDNFPHLRDMQLPDEWEGTVLDGEILMNVETLDTGATQTEGTLTASAVVANAGPEVSVRIQQKYGWAEFRAFDLLFYKGRDVRQEPYHVRRTLLKAVVGEWKQIHPETRISPTEVITKDIRKYYESVVKAGGEGIMLKWIHGKYESGKRSKVLLKWKKFYTVDGWITGSVPSDDEKGFKNLVGALEISTHDEKGNVFVIGNPQPGTLEFRREISNQDGSLKSEWFGKCVEISFQTLTKNNMGRHCTLKCFRPDKTPDMCSVNVNDIKRSGVMKGSEE